MSGPGLRLLAQIASRSAEEGRRAFGGVDHVQLEQRGDLVVARAGGVNLAPSVAQVRV
jgi:hypothetical protein